MKKLSTLLIACICLVVNAQWQHSGGPEGIDVKSINVLDNGTLINQNHIYYVGYSTDNGDNWNQTAMNGIPSDDRIVFGRFTVSGNSLLFYSFDYDRVYRSADNGENWSESNTGITIPVTAQSLFTFNDTVYLQVSDGFYKSGDNGQNWSKETISGSKLNVNTIISNNLWISPGSGGIYYSEDKGKTWQNATGDIGSSYAFSVVPLGGKLYASSTDEIYKSEDNGKSWTTTDNQDRGNIKKLRVADGKLLGLSSEDGIYEISNEGTTFTKLNDGFTQPRVSDFVVHNGIFFAATPIGIYRSGTTGNSWTRANKGIGYSKVYQFASIDSTLFAGTSSGVWRSKSYGQRWVPMSTPDIKFNSVITLGTDLYAACEEGVYKSSDKGGSFQLIGSGYPIVVDPVIGTNGTDLYLTAYQGSENGTYVLSNFSGSWSKVSGVPGAIHFWSDPSNSNIYIGKYISENNGSSWSSVSGLGEVGKVYSYNRFDGKVYAGVFSKIKGKPFLFEASDGKSFSSFTSGMDSKAQTTRHVVYGDSLIVDANIAGGNSIIYYKKPGDASFSEFDNSGLPNKKVEPIYANAYSLFLGSVEGVYRYDLQALPEVPDTVDQIEYPPLETALPSNISNTNELNIYPNPASSFVNIKSSESIRSINIHNMQGQVVKQIEGLSSKALSLNLSELNKGLYLMQLQGQDGKINMHKIIKK